MEKIDTDYKRWTGKFRMRQPITDPTIFSKVSLIYSDYLQIWKQEFSRVSSRGLRWGNKVSNLKWSIKAHFTSCHSYFLGLLHVFQVFIQISLMIVKVRIVTMETNSVGYNLQCLQQERKGEIQKRNIWRDAYVCHFQRRSRIHFCHVQELFLASIIRFSRSMFHSTSPSFNTSRSDFSKDVTILGHIRIPGIGLELTCKWRWCGGVFSNANYIHFFLMIFFA